MGTCMDTSWATLTLPHGVGKREYQNPFSVYSISCIISSQHVLKLYVIMTVRFLLCMPAKLPVMALGFQMVQALGAFCKLQASKIKIKTHHERGRSSLIFFDKLINSSISQWFIMHGSSVMAQKGTAFLAIEHEPWGVNSWLADPLINDFLNIQRNWPRIGGFSVPRTLFLAPVDARGQTAYKFLLSVFAFPKCDIAHPKSPLGLLREHQDRLQDHLGLVQGSESECWGVLGILLLENREVTKFPFHVFW